MNLIKQIRRTSTDPNHKSPNRSWRASVSFAPLPPPTLPVQPLSWWRCLDYGVRSCTWVIAADWEQTAHLLIHSLTSKQIIKIFFHSIGSRRELLLLFCSYSVFWNCYNWELLCPKREKIERNMNEEVRRQKNEWNTIKRSLLFNISFCSPRGSRSMFASFLLLLFASFPTSSFLPTCDSHFHFIFKSRFLFSPFNLYFFSSFNSVRVPFPFSLPSPHPNYSIIYLFRYKSLEN